MTRSERASQIWAVLAWSARHRQNMTYTQLGKAIGGPPVALGEWLEPIQSYCLLKRLPPLTILVVQQDTGMPGSGFTGATAKEFAAAIQNVFNFDWLELGNPGAEHLAEAVRELPSNAH